MRRPSVRPRPRVPLSLSRRGGDPVLLCPFAVPSPGRSPAWTRGAARSSPAGPGDPRGSRRPDRPRPVPPSCRLSGAVLVSRRLKTASPGRRVLGVKTCSFGTLSVCPPVARWPRGLRGAAASGSGAPPRWGRPDSPRGPAGPRAPPVGLRRSGRGPGGCSRVRVDARRAGGREEFGEALAHDLLEVPFCRFLLPPSSTAVMVAHKSRGLRASFFLPSLSPAPTGPVRLAFLHIRRLAPPAAPSSASFPGNF